MNLTFQRTSRSVKRTYRAFGAFTLGISVIAGMLVFGTAEPASASAFTDEVRNIVNNERAAQGLPALQYAGDLESFAQSWATEMGNSGYRHSTYTQPGYNTGAENVEMGETEPWEVMESWMNSSGHRANILNADFTHIGVGYDSAKHTWVQEFGGNTQPVYTPPPEPAYTPPPEPMPVYTDPPAPAAPPASAAPSPSASPSASAAPSASSTPSAKPSSSAAPKPSSSSAPKPTATPSAPTVTETVRADGATEKATTTAKADGSTKTVTTVKLADGTTTSVTTTTPPSKEKAEEFVELEAEKAAEEAADVTSNETDSRGAPGSDSQPSVSANAEPAGEQGPWAEIVSMTRGLLAAILAFSFAFPLFRRL